LRLKNGLQNTLIATTNKILNQHLND